MRITILVLLLGSLLLATRVDAAEIIWASENPDPTIGDVGFVDLLEGAGHDVTRLNTSPRVALTPSEISQINNADLVIIGRAAQSASFQEADEVTIWNTQITSPMLMMSPFPIRTNRAGWQVGNTLPRAMDPYPLVAADPSHPIFSGITFGADGVTMANDYNMIIVASDMMSDPVPGGTVIATNPEVAGAVVAAEWPMGTMVTSDAAGMQTLSGNRYFLAGGSLEESGATFTTTAGILDLTSDGQQIFLNMVNYALGTDAPLAGDFNDDGAVNAADYQILVNNLAGHLDGPVGRAEGDMNFDQRIDLTDFGLFKTAFPGALGQGQAIPEPTTVAILVNFLAVLGLYRWRK